MDKAFLDCYHQKVNVLVVSRAAEQLKAWNLRKSGNFNKIPEKLDGKSPTSHAKVKF